MRKPGGIPMIAMAREDNAPADEDHLNHEDRDNEQSADGDGDIVEQAITGIVDCLNARGPGAVARIRQYAQALQGMADAFVDRDDAAFTDAAGDAYRALRHLISS